MAVETTRENEAKFQLSPDLLSKLTPPALILDGYITRPLGLQTHTDTYVDTPSFDLLRHGVVLRIRQKGEYFEAGIKGLEAVQRGTVQERMDIAIPLPVDRDPFDPAEWPKEVKEHLAPYARAIDEMRTIVIVHQERHKSYISPLTSQSLLAEWSVDEVWLRPPLNGTTTDGSNGDEQESSDRTDSSLATSFSLPAVSHFHELEIELLSTTDVEEAEATDSSQDAEKAFANLVHQVQEQFSLSPIYDSKLVRGLRGVVSKAHGDHDRIEPTMELAAAGRLILHQQLIQILLNENGVRSGNKARYVHDMRVAIRRARAALQLCKHTFSAKELAPHKKGLKLLGSALGAVRDLDVALANLGSFKRNQPKSHAKAIKRLRTELKSQRAQAHAELTKVLDSKGYRKFIETYVEFCTASQTVDQESNSRRYEVTPSQVCHTLPSVILHAFESVRAYEVLFSGGNLPALESMHAMRIQSKYLRYLLEFSQHLLGKEGESLLIQLRDFQDHLGQLNDAHVEELRLREWSEQMSDDEVLVGAIAIRLKETRTQVDRLAALVPMRLESLISPSTRKKLAIALARI